MYPPPPEITVKGRPPRGELSGKQQICFVRLEWSGAWGEGGGRRGRSERRERMLFGVWGGRWGGGWEVGGGWRWGKVGGEG